MQPSDNEYQDIYSGRGTAESEEIVHGESHILVDEGSVIFREGERGHSAFLLERGEVEISVQRNGQNVTLARRGPGDVFGEMAIIDDQPRSATVRALRPCQLLMITRDQLVSRIEQTDPVLRMCLRVILQRFRSTLLRLQVMDHDELQPAHDRTFGETAGTSIHEEAVREIKLEEELRQALRQEDFALNYQPIVDLRTSRPVGFEALIRWNHKHRGLIAPDVFIPTAEASGLIVPIGHWVFEQACHAIARLGAAAGTAGSTDERLFMSVNLSVRDFSDAACVDKIREILAQSGVEPTCLKLEITESLLMHQPETAAAALRQFKAMGMSIAIDDFGTGYSSLAYLHKFPIDTLKIDRSFLKGLEEHSENFEIVSSIVHMAQRLNMDVVAEGIEMPSQVEILGNLGCSLGQGYLYAKPAEEDEAAQLLQDWENKRCDYKKAG
ncbi:MAG: EAL domain-containing protein [Alphaproteobacteria bacterium]|nr:EAL domain-containing protein [Alphaproteobacteria bacterium]